ncbi:phosphatidylglycerophosphatase B [Enterobacillus tribolii]|uniref:undecaprenyl-diphosphate phosphatase n=1 Tax=Enterobacillus tribolii TaxID=1487935 RepID=A0A370R344_9GAMM|nr:phosphatidylglycerophosphatase B [Enterobacillus tribolii]MBW7983904.1 phosphatidylglycerophosphatase B [Enterobacillus tribolii]RDK96841.1 phosphatidylglycerophosphatase [Enterobacillus tribolii]
MSQIIRRVCWGTLLLLVMPAAVWVSGWQWLPGFNEGALRALFAVTETVTSPWGAITSLLLTGWFIVCLRLRFRSGVMLFVILNAAIFAGQGVKSLIKSSVKEPRPYVLWLEERHHISPDFFYELKRKQRSALVTEQLAQESAVPAWLRAHWAFETGYAFPSGHTMFAASWALLAIGILWPRRRYLTVTVITLWAIAVMGSRMLLGMHWPMDLMVSTLISAVIVIPATYLAGRLKGGEMG